MSVTKFRGSALVKTIAFLLAVALASCACGAGAGALILASDRDCYAGVNAYDEVYWRGENLEFYLLLKTHQQDLTVNGQIALKDYEEWTLDPENSNFRFRVRKGDRVIYANTKQDIPEDSAKTGYQEFAWDSYELGMRQNVGYYLNLNRVTDWKLTTGTPQDWAQEEFGSRYYYSGEALREVLTAVQQEQGMEDGSLYYDEEGNLVLKMDGGWEEWDSVGAVLEREEQTEAENAEESEPVEYAYGPAAGLEDVRVVDEFGGEAEEVPADAENSLYYYYVYTGTPEQYYVDCWMDPDLPVNDYFRERVLRSESAAENWEQYSPILTQVMVGSLVSFALVLALLSWMWGWNKQGVLDLRGTNRCSAEGLLLGIFAALFLDLCIGWLAHFGYGEAYRVQWFMVVCAVCGAVGSIACLLAWLGITAQLKTHTLRKKSWVVGAVRWLNGIWKRFLVSFGKAVDLMPLYWQIACGGIVYLFLYMFIIRYVWRFWFWNLYAFCLLTLILLAPPLVLACKWAVDWYALRKAVRQMVEGQLDIRVDTTHMLPDLRHHGEELQNLSEGLRRAVEEQVKGQRFKTELITNVSHDLKTPLTSIINYVDLLKKLDLQDEQAREYIAVLDRKSQRLKTLTEDLVEASKAASGTVSVHLETLDLAQLADQALGEYAERLELAALTPVVQLPETPCLVQGDGRHIWRILDNLLGNCTKYAMPGTRVYLQVQQQGAYGVVTLKNISADPLNVPPEELVKRFVRGDSARSTEGSGLGLSIARNLTTVQKGRFDLVVDGDLFKAVVELPLAETKE